MKKFITYLAALFACASLLTACGNGEIEAPDTTVAEETAEETAEKSEIAREGLWAEAIYVSDTEVGTGSRTVMVEVKAGEAAITLTVKTDETILGKALLDNGIIEGEDGAYGLYVKKVNGILADYDIDQSYWGFYKNGEYMMTGVDGTEFADGERYELVYTK